MKASVNQYEREISIPALGDYESALQYLLSMKNLFLLLGNNAYVHQQFLRDWAEKAVEKYGEINVSRFALEEKELGTLRAELLAPSFFGDGKRIFFLEGFPVAANAKKKEKEKAEQLLVMIEEIPEETVLVCSAYQPDKRTKVYKALQKLAAKVYSFDAWPTDRNGALTSEGKAEATNWIGALFQEKGVHVDPRTIAFFLDYCGTDTWKLSREIEKLSLWSTSTGKSIGQPEIKELCLPSGQMENFAFSSAMQSGDKKRVLKVFHELIEEQGIAQMILARDIIPTFRQLLFVQRALRERVPAKETPIHPFVFGRIKSVAQKIPEDVLREAYVELQQIDYDLKTGALPSVPQKIQLFALTIERLLLKTLP